MSKIYITPCRVLADYSKSPFPTTKKILMHCYCDTKHNGTDYKKNKLGWAECDSWEKETCPTCGNFYFFFVDKGGVRYNNKHNLKEK